MSTIIAFDIQSAIIESMGNYSVTYFTVAFSFFLFTIYFGIFAQKIPTVHIEQDLMSHLTVSAIFTTTYTFRHYNWYHC